jgi:hypothetical protein
MASYRPPPAVLRKPAKDPNAPKKPCQAWQFYRKHVVDTDDEVKSLPFGDQSREASQLTHIAQWCVAYVLVLREGGGEGVLTSESTQG